VKKLEMGEAEYKGLARIAGQLDFFAPLKGAQLEKFLSHIQFYSFAKKEVVFKKGDSPEAFYVIYEGGVTIRFNPGWIWVKRKIARLGPGNLFGEMALVENRPRAAVAFATEVTKLFVFLREDFEALMRQNPIFAEEIRLIIARRKFEATH
jgi:CRP/FNR family cyclic AMP-dependent transcriptional regulator